VEVYQIDLKQMNEFIAKWYTYPGRKFKINRAAKTERFRFF